MQPCDAPAPLDISAIAELAAQEGLRFGESPWARAVERFGPVGQTLAITVDPDLARLIADSRGIGAWAAGSPQLLRRIDRLPEGVVRVDIYVDPGLMGAAEPLAARLVLAGHEVWVLRPPAPYATWPEAVSARGPAVLQEVLTQADPWDLPVIVEARRELARLERQARAEETRKVRRLKGCWQRFLARALRQVDPLRALRGYVAGALAELEGVSLDHALGVVVQQYRAAKFRIELRTLRRLVRERQEALSRQAAARDELIAHHRETLGQRQALLQALAMTSEPDEEVHRPAEPGQAEAVERSATWLVRQGRYGVRGHALYLIKKTPQGEEEVPLANFAAYIRAEEVRDDGATAERSFLIEGTLATGEDLPPARVPAGQYSAMGWVPAAWGARAIIYAGPTIREHVRVAIQELSREIARRVVYGHLGWRRIDGQWRYLHGGGAIGPEGPVEDVEVAVGDHPDLDRLQYYRLPKPPQGEELRQCIRAALARMRLADRTVTVPLLAASYRAVLSQCDAPDYSLFLVGPTGAKKSELTAIVLADYGQRFTRLSLPTSWSATENALEYAAFVAKDALLVIDDFAPVGTTTDVQELHRKADRVLRAVGNRQGRGRMGPDMRMRPTYYPRGLIVTSGEDLPRGQSLRGRLLALEVGPGTVNLKRLTQAQQAAADGTYSKALAGYVQWVAGRVDELAVWLPCWRRRLRTLARRHLLGHDRTPDIVASLACGWWLLLRFAQQAGAISNRTRRRLWRGGWRALLRAGAAQEAHQASEDTVYRFLALLAAALVGGDAHVCAARSGDPPPDASWWGWRLAETGDGEERWCPQGRRIGWMDGEDLWLEPDAAYAVVQELARRQGTVLPVTQRTLHKRLQEAGLLASWEKGRFTTKPPYEIDGRRPRVLHLPATVLEGDIRERPGQAGRQGRNARMDGALPLPHFAKPTGAEPGQPPTPTGATEVPSGSPHSLPRCCPVSAGKRGGVEARQDNGWDRSAPLAPVPSTYAPDGAASPPRRIVAGGGI